MFHDWRDCPIRRDKLDILKDILAICNKRRAKKTEITYGSNLSFIKVNEYLSWLIAHKFLKQDGNTYEATPAGRSFLVKLSHVKKL